MFRKILVPVDGSESSKLALDKSIEIAKKFDSRIYLLTIIPQVLVVENLPQTYTNTVKNEILDVSKAELEKYKDEYNDSGVIMETDYIVGNVSKEILNYADDKDIDLIVMGNRGLGAFSRTILGSVSNKVVNGSHCSVLVVKHK